MSTPLHYKEESKGTKEQVMTKHILSALVGKGRKIWNRVSLRVPGYKRILDEPSHY